MLLRDFQNLEEYYKNSKLLKFFKKFHWHVKEYLKSPFIWWGISFLILEKLDEIFLPVHQFRLLLWANELNLVFFIPATFMAMSLIFTPYRNGIISMLKTKQHFGHSFLYLGSIIMAFTTEGIIYRAGIVAIIGNQFKETVIDQQYFEQLEFYIFLFSFFLIPSIIIYLQSNIKKEFQKHKIQINTIRWDNVIIINWMLFVLLLIGFWIYNILIIESLKC